MKSRSILFLLLMIVGILFSACSYKTIYCCDNATQSDCQNIKRNQL